MTTTTLSSGLLCKNIAAVKREAMNGPVIIMNRGKATHVLLCYEAYRRLVQSRCNIADALSMPESAHVDYEPSRVVIEVKSPDLS